MQVIEPVTHEDNFFARLSKSPSIRLLTTSQQRGWEGIVAYVGMIQRAAVFSFTSQKHSVHFHLQGGVRVRWQHGQHDRTEHCSPGCITIVPAGEPHRFEVNGPCKFLSWVLDPHKIESLLQADAGFRGQSWQLQPLFAGNDPALWTLAEALARELDNPGLGSRLYVESLELGLIVQFLRRSSPTTLLELPGSGTLPAQKPRTATEFISANLGEGISLESLAEAVRMSPYHFAKLFKRATGRSPHRYVLEQRVEKAKQLLEEGDLSIAQTALQVGFCSQSHLTEVFRRLVGVTPGVYQKACG